jgi:predicted DsbA family dithiol-disulfide isomerase
VKVTWVHFPLHPETPAEGISLEALFAGRDIDIDAMHGAMKARMDAENLPYEKRSHTYNSRLAQELGKWADTQPGGGAIHDALFKAYFVDGANIGAADILLDIAASVGLPVEEAKSVLDDRSFQKAVDIDWDKSRQFGVTGVPTFVAGGYGVVGCQPYETLHALLEKASGGEG